MGYDCTRVCSHEFIVNGNNFQSCFVSVIRPDLVQNAGGGGSVFNLTVQNVHVVHTCTLHG